MYSIYLCKFFFFFKSLATFCYVIGLPLPFLFYYVYQRQTNVRANLGINMMTTLTTQMITEWFFHSILIFAHHNYGHSVQRAPASGCTVKRAMSYSFTLAAALLHIKNSWSQANMAKHINIYCTDALQAFIHGHTQCSISTWRKRLQPQLESDGNV